MSKYILILSLLFATSSCFLFRKTSTGSTEPVSGVTSVPRGDTLTVVLPDSLRANSPAKTTILSQIFSGKKVKNKGTIIIQTGERSVAAKVDKAKGAPVAVSQEPATATRIDKPKNSAITSGDNAPASATQTTEQGFNWSWLLVIALGALLVYGYRKVMG